MNIKHLLQEMLPPALFRLIVQLSRRIRESRQGLDSSREVRANKRVLLNLAGKNLAAPRSHALFEYQAKYPLYDKYFLPFLAMANAQGERFDVIDIGANIGDTACAIIQSSPGSRIVSVEGSEQFLPYLVQNVSNSPDVLIVPAYLDMGIPSVRVQESRGTGSLVPDATGDSALNFVSVEDVIAQSNQFLCSSSRIWKSDTDGHDISILNQHWEEITAVCNVLWIEWDPDLHAGAAADIKSLAEKIAASQLVCCVFDNFGRPVIRLEGAAALSGLLDLSAYLTIQWQLQHRSIYYFDIWVLDSLWATRLWSTTTSLSR